MTDALIFFPDPCGAEWEAMRPEGRGRFCDGCGKVVHDVAQHTPEEVEALLTQHDDPVCLRAEPAPDGIASTVASPTGRRLAVAVVTPIIMAALAASAVAAPRGGSIVGSLLSYRPNTSVTASRGGFRKTVTVDDEGTYHFERLPPGTYKLIFRSRKREWSVRGVLVRTGAVVVANSRDTAVPPPMHPTLLPPPPMGLPAVPPLPTPPTPKPVGQGMTMPQPASPPASNGSPGSGLD